MGDGWWRAGAVGGSDIAWGADGFGSPGRGGILDRRAWSADEVPDRGSGDLICLLTSILDPRKAPALMLAEAYHQRWQHEAANKEIKTQMRGPARVLRSKSPDMVRQEIQGHLLAHYAVCAFICQAAEETGIDPDRVTFTNTFLIIGDRLADPEAFPPDHQRQTRAELGAETTGRRNLNPVRHRDYPRVVKRARHNSYPVKRQGHKGTRHNGPATVHLANHSFITTPTGKPQVKALSGTSYCKWHWALAPQYRCLTLQVVRRGRSDLLMM